MFQRTFDEALPIRAWVGTPLIFGGKVNSKGNGNLLTDLQLGGTSANLNNVTGYHVGGSINLDTGRGGSQLESRVITSIDNVTNTITFEPGVAQDHQAGSNVTGPSNNIAASDPFAGAAVTPRVIGRIEITYRDGSNTTIATDGSWRTSLGPLITDAWYSGSDYDARREQIGRDSPDAELTSPRWINAGIAPPSKSGHEIRRSCRRARPGIWVFDSGQNIVGWPVLTVPQLPAGTTIKVAPSESLSANGTINQTSLGPASRGTDLFYNYTTAGREGSESNHPRFHYFGMQWVQVTGLPNDFQPTSETITGLRVQGNVPIAGTFNSSNSRLNRIHKMVRYSFASNIMSVFTDCPGREKLSYPADYTMPMGAIFRNCRLTAFLRTTMRHLVEGQSIANTSMAVNIALEMPVYDLGYSGRFGDEINWGNAIVLAPTYYPTCCKALALDAGLVPEDRHQEVLNALVELAYAYPSSDGQGPHLSGGTIGLGPIVRALSAGGRDDVLWEALQQNDRPSYGYFLASTPENPNGYTTIGEAWDRSASKNHMIVAEIEEWFHASVAGIQPAAVNAISATWGSGLVFQPKPVGDLESAAGTYQLQAGEARSEWNRTSNGTFSLKVTVPANTQAEVRVPAVAAANASGRASYVGRQDGYEVYTVPSGVQTFGSVVQI
ncbi:hypothetical protein B9Z65_1547 [Elsinoe australis]|uniref:alpha-L-rhamnosidase n=1 Tax=Elsinoe australis TaxID=40998 RepID=A0A2P7YG85_9PEZI|nr:hypothetical protein B9Z65_1547 [Elsinoe australis]